MQNDALPLASFYSQTAGPTCQPSLPASSPVDEWTPPVRIIPYLQPPIPFASHGRVTTRLQPVHAPPTSSTSHTDPAPPPHPPHHRSRPVAIPPPCAPDQAAMGGIGPSSPPLVPPPLCPIKTTSRAPLHAANARPLPLSSLPLLRCQSPPPPPLLSFG